MAGRNLEMNLSLLQSYLNDFRHKLFTTGWKPVMLFKVDLVPYRNATPTNMRTEGEHTRSYELPQEEVGAIILLALNDAISHQRPPSVNLLQMNLSNAVANSVSQYGHVSTILVSDQSTGSLQVKVTSITQYLIGSQLTTA